MKKLTVFTPSYNRAHLLPRLYESLCRQSSKDFLWLLIDDGSTDDTKEWIEKWKAEGKIEIEYYYKKNGGMHTAHNAAYSMIKTELNVCIDSDDWMPDDAVELILKKWDSIDDKTKIAGIIGLDAEESGKIVGTMIPKNTKQGSFNDLYKKHNVKGDKKVILRTDIAKEYPSYPEYKGEKLVPLGILYLMIGRDHEFVYSNEVYCIVEYQAEGSSRTIFKQYKQSPRGFAYARNIGKLYSESFFHKFKNSIHIVSSAIFAREIRLIYHKPQMLLNILAIPLGVLLNLYIRFKLKK